MQDLSRCPHCGSDYTETYSGRDVVRGEVDYHCFSCGSDFTVPTLSVRCFACGKRVPVEEATRLEHFPKLTYACLRCMTAPKDGGTPHPPPDRLR